MDTYTAFSLIANPALANVRNFVTSFQLYPKDPYNDPFKFDVTSAIVSALGAPLRYPYVGFSIRQIADNCGASGTYSGGYDCSALFGPNDNVFYPTLSISYDIQPVPEPSTWAMMIAGFALVGANLRMGRRPTVRVT